MRAQGGRVQEIITENGDRFCAATFADSSYEGDLMGQAKVTYTWGREGERDYGESLAGVRGRQRKDHHFNVRVSPFDANGALLPEVFAGPKGQPGEGDKKMQAYTYRMCLSEDPQNRVPFVKPAGYDVRRYELLARLVAALEVDHGHAPGIKEFLLMLHLPNAKYDINSFGGYSTDHIGANWDYATASYERRAAIWKEHYEYEAGLFYFLANDARMPAALRAAVGALGLAKDEFADNGNWPLPVVYPRVAANGGGVCDDAAGYSRPDHQAGTASGWVPTRATRTMCSGWRPAERRGGERGRDVCADAPLPDPVSHPAAEAGPGG